MKLNRKMIRKMILNEIKLVKESTAVDARSAINKASASVQTKDAGSSKSQKGIANIISMISSRYLHKENISEAEVATMKKYIDSVAKTYFVKD
jgi:hypothetical protein